MNQPRRQSVAIMFTDLCGYSAWVQRDEDQALNMLQVHWDLLRPVFAAHEGHEIKTIGDAFLIEYPSALQAVRSGFAMLSRLDEHNREVEEAKRIRIRIGIHVGDVERIGGDVFGDGVNIASRIEPLAPASGMAISNTVFHLVQNRLGSRFKSIGEPSLKNISAPVEVYVADIGEQQAVRHGIPKLLRRTKTRWFATLMGILFAAALIHTWNQWTDPLPVESPISRDVGRPVVAVIPFESIGDGSGPLLASGLHNDLLTRLAQLGTFSVISRTSMLEYAGTTKSILQIGRELGAGYVLEGGVQIIEHRIRINAQLIDAASDLHLWAQTYDRSYSATELFDVQAELARSIADQLRLTLSETDRQLVAEVPTVNTDAYRAYLEALALNDEPSGDFRDVQKIVAALERAVVLDPDFVDAWAMLARLRFATRLPSVAPEQSQALGREALAKAHAIDPDHYEVVLARISELYYVEHNYDEVLSSIDRLAKRGPLIVEALVYRGKALRRLARFEEAYRAFLAAERLDPRNYSVVSDAHFNAAMYRDCGAMATQSAKLLLLAPDSVDARSRAARYELVCNLDATRASQLLDGVEFTDMDQLWVARDTAAIQRNWLKLGMLLDRELPPKGEPWSTMEGLDTDLAKVWLFRREGDADAVNAVIADMRDRIDRLDDFKSTVDGSLQPLAHLFLAAAIGDRDSVMRKADQFKQIALPDTGVDPLQLQWGLRLLLFVYAQTGLQEEALYTLERVLSQPGEITFRFVDAHPLFDSLRNEPRYIEIRNQYGAVSQVSSEVVRAGTAK